MKSPALLLSALTLGVALASLAIGPSGWDAATLAAAARGDAAAQIILFDIRLPRILAALLVGAALGGCGAAMQALTANPLAEPGVLGVSAAATLGATLMLYFGVGQLIWFAVPAGAIVMAMGATALLALAALRLRGMASLILIGVGLSSLAGAVMALVLNFAPNPFSLSDLVNWSLGSVANRSMPDVALTLPLVAAGLALLLTQSRALSLMTLGEEAARAQGLDFARMRLLVVMGCGLATGASVALAGAVGFVGIVAPHLVRPWVGHDPGRAMGPAIALGALIVLLADILIRVTPTTNELRLGVVAALAGAPVFLAITLRRGTVRHG